jgi:predicted AAA+ superfamily ATPase
LDIVHQVIESRNIRFALTGSSARKLKRGAANLLAGRAFVYYLYPFTSQELGKTFALDSAFTWGTLPKVLAFQKNQEKELFLEAYCHTYLKEEVLAEQIVRKVVPFRRFLEVAAQCNGEVLNFSKIGEDVGVDSKTVASYYQVLEDTMIGFMLPAYHRSIRKQQSLAPKFYLFDCGVKNALDGTLGTPLRKGTYAYGRAFEHFITLEIARLNSYFTKRFKLSYLLTKDGAEIDLIVERPRKKLALIEIKSAESVTDRHLKHLQRFASEMSEAEAFCFCQEERARMSGDVRVVPWRDGLKKLFE